MSIKEQKKNEIRQTRKRKYTTLIKNQLKKVDSYLEGGKINKDELEKLFRKVQKVLDKASQKKIIHKNRAAAGKSELRNKINKFKKEEFLER